MSAENLSKSYGIKPLFQNISFHISEGDKIALVARNGSGKSTLLKIIADKEIADDGKLWLNKNVEVAFFEQDPKLEDQATVLDNIFHAAHPVINIIKQYENALEMEEHDKVGNILIQMDELGAWDFEAKVKK
ncbi:MAG TPA: ATP-binding cassette domain-containing protein, partial [Flavisolibacter sp.]|nr:ATP-binding cassette domain-containing protein [Flavisolibacter sp.]